jgi:alkaline phosphatase D
VVVCTDDVHNCYAGALRPDFKDSASIAVGVEFVGGSVSSFGIVEMIGQDLTELGRRLVPHVNPRIADLDIKHHVYTKVIVSPTQMDLRDTSRSERLHSPSSVPSCCSDSSFSMGRHA